MPANALSRVGTPKMPHSLVTSSGFAPRYDFLRAVFEYIVLGGVVFFGIIAMDGSSSVRSAASVAIFFIFLSMTNDAPNELEAFGWKFRGVSALSIKWALSCVIASVFILSA
jgi:hypothetical protein